MGDIEFLLLLLLAAAVLVRLADVVAVPYPIVLVVGGLAIGLVPWLPDLVLEPDVVFLIFLPPLLHAAGWYSDPRMLKAEVRPLALLAVGLVLATMVAVAVVAHAIVPGMSWEAAFLLGAIVGPTDPVSASATFARLGVPERVRGLVEGEAMINDGTALVAYRVALVAAVEGTFSFGDALLEFAYSAAGGVAAGLAIGWLGYKVIEQPERHDAEHLLLRPRRLRQLHRRRGAAARLGRAGDRHQRHLRRLERPPADRRRHPAVGRGLLARDDLRPRDAAVRPAGPAGAAAGRGARGGGARRAGARRRALRRRRADGLGAADPGRLRRHLRERVVVGWAGMRGAISLAAALGVSTAVQERPQILLITFGVIFVTLLGQGLTLPPLLRALKLRSDTEFSPDEAIARLETAQAALDRLDELEEEGASEEAIRRLRELYRARFAVCVAVLGGDVPEDGRRELHAYGELRRDLIATERAALLDLRSKGIVAARRAAPDRARPRPRRVRASAS